MPSLGFFLPPKLLKLAFNYCSHFFFPRVEQESNLERSLCPLGAAEPLSSFHFSLWSEKYLPAFLPQHRWQVEVTGSGDMQIPKPSAVTFWLPGLGWPFSGTAGAGETCQSHTWFHLLVKDLRRKRGGGRNGKVFQYITSSGCSFEMFHKVFPAPLGALGRVYQPQGSGGGEEGKWEQLMNRTWCYHRALWRLLGVPAVMELSALWPCPSEGTGTHNKACCSCSYAWFSRSSPAGERQELPSASQILCQLCWATEGSAIPMLGSAQSSSERAICYLWELAVGKHGRNWRKSACGT